jgi:hypothetical protein
MWYLSPDKNLHIFWTSGISYASSKLDLELRYLKFNAQITNACAKIA